MLLGGDNTVCFDEGVVEFVVRDAYVGDDESGGGQFGAVSDEAPMSVWRDGAFG